MSARCTMFDPSPRTCRVCGCDLEDRLGPYPFVRTGMEQDEEVCGRAECCAHEYGDAIDQIVIAIFPDEEFTPQILTGDAGLLANLRQAAE